MMLSKIFLCVTVLHLLASVIQGVLLIGECGLNRGAILFLFYLVPMGFVSWAFFTGLYENLTPMDRGMRGKITESDVLIMKVVGPWLLLILQCFLCVGALYFTSDFLKNGPPARACEYRSRFR